MIALADHLKISEAVFRLSAPGIPNRPGKSREVVKKKNKGECHFAWVLGGRGIQDVLFATGAPSNKFGTSLRCYDIAVDFGRIT